MKGCELNDSRSLGLIGPERVHGECDELVQLIGKAIGDHEIPPVTLWTIAQAVAIVVMYPEAKGRPAHDVLASGQERLDTNQRIADERARLARTHGWDVANDAVRRMFDIGQAIFAALGARHIPDDACYLLAGVASDVADHATSVRFL